MDQLTRVTLLRHGRTAWNASRRLQGHVDIPLDAHGLAQAAQLAQAFHGEPLDAVYSSDLQRALQTAAPLAAAAGLPVQPQASLRERSFGHLEGATFEEVEQHWPEEARRWRSREPGFAPGGGEALQDFYRRCVQAVADLASRHPGGHIVVVAHGGVLDCLYRAAVGVALQAPRTWQLDNATLNRLLWNGKGFVLVGWNDDSHLAAPD